MISLSFPSVTQSWYVNLVGFAVGPMANTSIMPPAPITYRAPCDFISQIPGSMYHEKGVIQEQSEGTIMFQPGIYSWTAVPSLVYPLGGTLKGVTRTRGYNQGIGYDGAVGIQNSSTCNHYILEQLDHLKWRVHTLNLNSAKTEATNYRQSDFTLTPRGGSVTSWVCSLVESVWTVASTSHVYLSGDWSALKSAKQILEKALEVESMATPQSPLVFTWPSTTVPAQESSSSTWVDPAVAVGAVNRSLIILRGQQDPLDYDYGDLAVQASEQVNATHVNMLAFLRDLKDPKALIPKLQNLRNLKSYADVYLTVKYGILPTISDLQNIAAAFKRLKSNLDRFGHRTFSAGHTSSLDLPNYEAFKTQRLKLAIAAEDQMICRLASNLESIGMLPTFKSVWDLVPYTFCVDWFVDVGEFLQRADTHLRLMRFNIKYVTSSRKVEKSTLLKPSATLPYSGKLSWVQYHRWVSDQCPLPTLSSLNSHLGEFNHWLDASALLIQRKPS